MAGGGAELIAAGQPDQALATLHDVITSKRHRTWSPVHETIMLKYVDLCVTLQRGRHAKDGLHQYKNITAQTAVGSLETVIRHYLRSALARVAEAQATLKDVNLGDVVEDLEATETPESLLLAAVSDDGVDGRREKTVLMPWLKFLWEAFRTVLDILRNNVKLERLYAEATIQVRRGWLVTWAGPCVG